LRENDFLLFPVSWLEQKATKPKEEKTMTKTIRINGMMCAHCEARMKNALEAIDGVVSAVASHEQNNAVLELSKEVSEEVLCKAVTDAGYEYVK